MRTSKKDKSAVFVNKESKYSYNIFIALRHMFIIYHWYGFCVLLTYLGKRLTQESEKNFRNSEYLKLKVCISSMRDKKTQFPGSELDVIAFWLVLDFSPKFPN